MDYLQNLICFGIVINIFVNNVAAQEYVTVGRSMEVKATPNPLVDVKQRVDVELNCTGSPSEISYYIKNRVVWSHIDSEGNELQLTEGFYPAKVAENLFFGASGQYLLSYKRDVNGYRFDIRINGVTHSDNGIFRCSLLNENGKVIDSKDVTLTVVNPVQKVSLEIHDMDHNVIAQSDVPLGSNSTPISISPGQYMIQCDSYGSNPAPTMEIWHNENMLNSDVVATKGTMNNQVSYNGTITVLSQDILPHTLVQTLTCSANIPGGYYPTIQSGLAVMVQYHKPEVTCNNVTTMVGNKYVKVNCEVTVDTASLAILNCTRVSWLLGDENVYIGYDERWNDPNGKFDILEGNCEHTGDALSVSLTIYKVKSVHFDELFYVTYESNYNTSYRYAVQEFNQVTFNNGPSIASSVTFLTSIFTLLIIVL